MLLSDPLIGRQLGDYRIVDMLGRGGMAHVYRGFDAKLQRYAAVKVIDTNLLAGQNEQEYRQRFQREARAVARLNHPNIVGVYQFGEVGALYYLAMAFIDGRDLGQILKDHAANRTFMPPQQILQIVHDIAGALDYAHAGGVIHRDIKPSNIMVTLDNRAVLTDFGLALSVPEGTQGNTFGSAHYIAPEQAISSANAIAQSDLYSLGVVLYQMLTGRVPFDDPSAMSVALMHLSDAPPSLRHLNPSVTPAVERVVLKALEKEPSKRFQNGESMARALEEALDLSTMNGRHLPPSSASRPSRLFRPELETSSPTLLFPDSRVAESRTRFQEARRRLRVSRRPLRLGLIVAILLVLAFVAWIIARPNVNSDAGAPTAAAALPSQTLPATARPVAAVITVEAVASQEAAATPAVTLIPLLLSTTPSAAKTVQAADAPIRLVYDPDKLVLVNQASRPVNIRGWSFVQESALGQLAFQALQWQSPILAAVPSGGCFLIWRNTLSDIATPDYCGQREAWFAAGTRTRFWVSARADATFVVENGATALATCPVNQGECGVDPGQ